MDGHLSQANLVEQKMNPLKGCNKRPAVLKWQERQFNKRK
jgi:hypothetical protein